MTILPKKKAEQQKGGSDDEQSSDHSASPHGASGHGASHGSPHQLDNPYDDSFSPHHHRASPDTFYHRYAGGLDLGGGIPTSEVDFPSLGLSKSNNVPVHHVALHEVGSMFLASLCHY